MLYSSSNVKILPRLHSCDKIITKVNKEFIDFTGFTMDELIGKSLMELGELIRINSQVFIDNIIINNSGYIFTKSLEAREVIISVMLDPNTNNKVYIIEENKNSRLIDKFNYIDQLYFDESFGIAIFQSSTFVLLKANQTYMSFFDEPACRLDYSIGKSIHNFCKYWTGSEANIALQMVADTGKPYINKEFLFEGFQRGLTYWDITFIPILENSKVKYIIETATEVTERVLNNQKLIEQNNIIDQQKKELYEKNLQLNNIINNLSEGVLITDSEGKYVMSNAEAKRLLYKSDKVIATGDSVKATKYYDMKGIEIPFDNLPGVAALSGKIVKNARLLASDQDKERFMDISSTPIFNGIGELSMVVSCFHDITEIIQHERFIKKQQDELLNAEQEKNEVLGRLLEMQEEFITNISHELKTPLNVIFATSQLLNLYCDRGSLDEKKDSIIKYIGSIKQNSYRLSKLINNIVDLSKIESGYFELNLSNNNIVEVLEEVVMSVSNYTKVKCLNIIFDTDTEEKIMVCDPEKIERILLNLISNAIKFSNKDNEILVDFKDKGEYVEISVTDNGIGIKDDHLDLIFDRFKQVDKSLSRNSEGTGLGLSIVKAIVELHNGSINVESEYGKGSKFTVVLPAGKTMQENMLLINKTRNKGENTQVELSDIGL